MGDKERGRLYSIQMDGSDSMPFIIKKDKLLIGRGDTCKVRMYIEGVASEHCVITFNEEGRGFVESVNKCDVTYLNGESIERQVSLEHNDVITIVKRSFRFLYPPSSAYRPATSSEESIIEKHLDFEPEDAFSKKDKEIPEKRVTFGPRLSPEEFDKNMPPASPLRKGSLPTDKLKAKTPDTERSHCKRVLFKGLASKRSPSSRVRVDRVSAGKQLPRSTVVLHKLGSGNDSGNQNEPNQSEESPTKSRPLFSDVLKKSVENSETDIVATKTLKKYNPKGINKKSVKLQNSKTFYKSPRPIHPQVLSVGSTGHANSPETIVIYKKKITPSENSLPSVEKRKSLRLRDNLNSGNSVSEKNEEHPESSNNTAVKESSPALHSDSHIDSLDSKNNSSAIPGSSCNAPLCEVYEETTKDKSEESCIENDTTSVQENSLNEIEEAESALAVAVDSAAHIEEYGMDKSLNDIHNAVKALVKVSSSLKKESVALNLGHAFDPNYELSSDTNNESSSDTNKSSSDTNNECLFPESTMRAVKRLALTVSMVNAMKMYRNIVDGISGFPTSFPSTSFGLSPQSMKLVKKFGARQGDDPASIARMTSFRNIMSNFFSNSSRRHDDDDDDEEDEDDDDDDNDNEEDDDDDDDEVSDVGRNCMYRSCVNDLSSEATSSKQNRNSKFVSKNTVAQKAIDSGCKNPKCKTVCTQHEDNAGVLSESEEDDDDYYYDDDDDDDDDDVQQTDIATNVHACGSSLDYTPGMSMAECNEDSNSSETPQRQSLPSDKGYCSYKSPLSHVQHSDNYETTENTNQQISKKSIDSNNMENLHENEQETFNENKEARSSAESKELRHFSFKSSKPMKLTPNTSVSRMASNLKITRAKKSETVVVKSQKISLVAKKHGIMTSKKIKEQKGTQHHRLSVLKKVNFKSPKVGIEGPDQIVKSSRAFMFPKSTEANNLPKTKDVGVSQKLVDLPKSRTSISSSTHLSTKIIASPKLLRKRNEKRKSVVFKSRGLKRKKSGLPSKSSGRRMSVVTITSPVAQVPKTARGKKGKKSQNDKIDYDNDTKTIPTRSRKNKKQEEKSVKNLSVKKQSGERKHSPVNDENKGVDSLDLKIDEHLQENITVVKRRGRSAKNVSVAPVKETRNMRKVQLTKVAEVHDVNENLESDKHLQENIPVAKRPERTRNMRKIQLTKVDEVHNVIENLVSVVEENTVDDSQNSDNDQLKNRGISTSEPEVKSSKGRRKVKASSKSDNQERTQKSEGTLLKEVTKDTAIRGLRSKKTQIDTASSKTTEAEAEKNSKQKSRKRKADQDLSETRMGTNAVEYVKEQTTTVAKQRNIGKLNAGNEDVPNSTPKRGRSKGRTVKTPKEKIHQTGITTRSLRSRK